MIAEELLQSFKSEAIDLLDDAEPSLIEYSRMETTEDRTEILNRVFRHFHSIKGSAGFVGLDAISKLTHEAENLLEQFRKGADRIIPQETINLLCRTVDLLRMMFDNDGKPPEAGGEIDYEAFLTELRNSVSAHRRSFSALSLSADEHAASSIMGATQSPRKAENVPPPPAKSAAPAPPPVAPVAPVAPAAPPPAADAPPEPEKIPGSQLVSRPSSGQSRVMSSKTVRKVKPGATPAEFASRYVSEGSETLEQIEQALLYAEQHPEASSESVQEALRLLHSFKGNCGFMGLGDLERLSHRMETEVENNSSKTLGLDSQVFDVLLQMIDVLRQGLLDFSCGGSGSIPETDAYLAIMDELAGGKSGETTVKPVSADSGKAKSSSSTDVIALPASAVPITVAPPLPPVQSPAPPAAPAAGGGQEISVAEREPRPPRNPESGGKEALVGKPSEQENLGAIERVGTIVITPAMIKPAEPETAKPQTPGAAPAAKEAAKDKDSAMKRRSSEQVAARNDIRVDLRKLDGMMDLVGELVIAEAMVTRHPVVWNAENESLERAVHQLRRVTNSLQDMATSVRMIPLAPTFRRMTRLVYDLSVKAGKQVDLVLLGEDTEVDRTVIERISDPLVHIIRNAIDHGIEIPADRLAAGKPETGRLTIEGHHEGSEVWIVITDDGRGLNRDAILAKAISRGMVAGDGSDMNDNQIFHFIFEPGFSTAAKVTDISGRGFGMDVVKKNIEKLSGRIDIRTRPGEGTAVVMRIPLTLAIIDGMLVQAGGTRYIIPLLSIRESLRPDLSQIFSTPDGQQLIKIREELIPIVKLDENFSRVQSTRDLADGILMIVEGEEGDVVALFADELLGQQETVIKGLSGWLKKSRGVSGCTILGDGEVGLILDIGSIVRLARQASGA